MTEESIARAKQRYAEYIWLAAGGEYLNTTSITVARKKLYARFLADLKLLVDRRATAIIESVVTGAVLPDPKELTRAVKTATEEIQSFFSQMTKAFEGVQEEAKKYVTYGHPNYTGIYDRDVMPISFGKYLELMKDDNYRRVGLTTLMSESGELIRVSTVWFGMDTSATTDVPPLIFESLVEGGKGDGRVDRYTTLQQAQAGHSNLLQWIREMDGAT